MSAADLRLIVEEQVESTGPKVFVQLISTPPGMPWDQSRIAGLEARSGAPLPMIDVAYQLHRLGGWAPGQAGRYAAFYVRKEEVGDRLETVETVEGRSIRVEFLSVAAQRRRGRRLLALAGVTAAIGLFVLGGTALVASARGRAADRLDAAEQLASRKLHQAAALEKLKTQTRALEHAQVRGHALGDVVRDLTWAATAKTATARIEGLHWQDGYMAVEVRGEEVPFERLDRPVQKSSKPARAGVWLWGVTPSEDTPSASGGAQ
jgi:hypothetical protein